MLVFTNPETEIGDVEEAPHPTIKDDELKAFIRQEAKSNPLPNHKAQAINDMLEEAEEDELEDA